MSNCIKCCHKKYSIDCVGNRPSENWQLYTDDNTMLQFARLVKIYQALGAYLKQAVQAYTQTGIPVQRALPYMFPSDNRSAYFDYEYMLGDDLLVVPVLEVG